MIGGGLVLGDFEEDLGKLESVLYWVLSGRGGNLAIECTNFYLGGP